MTPNDFRGEAVFVIDEKEYPLRLTLDSIRRLEVRLNMGWQKLVGRAFEGDLRFDDVCAVIWAGLLKEDGEEAFSFDSIASHVFKIGLLKSVPVVRNLLLLQAVGAEEAPEVKTAGGGRARQKGGRPKA